MEENTFERDPHIDSLRKAILLNWAIESGCYIITDNDRKITIITKDLRTQQTIQVNVKSGYMSAAEIAKYMNSLDHAFNEMALTAEQKYPGEGIIKRHEDWAPKPITKEANTKSLSSENDDEEHFINSLLNSLPESVQKEYVSFMNKQANKLLSYLESNPNFNKEILNELRSRWSDPEVRRQTQIDVVPEQTEDYSREA